MVPPPTVKSMARPCSCIDAPGRAVGGLQYDAGLGGGGEQAAHRLADVAGHLDAAAGGAGHRHHAAGRVLDAGRLVGLRLRRQLGGPEAGELGRHLLVQLVQGGGQARLLGPELIASCLSASAASASALRARASATAASLLAFSVRSCSWAAWYSANSSASLVVRTSRIAHLRLALVDDSSASIDRADSAGADERQKLRSQRAVADFPASPSPTADPRRR